MKKIILPLACVISLMEPALAKDYRLDIGAIAANVESDFGSVVLETDLKVLAATIFFTPIKSDKGPLAEAAYLSKASNWLLSTGKLDGDINSGIPFNMDSDITTIAMTYINPESGYIFGLLRTMADTTIESPIGKVYLETEDTGVRFGKYLTDSSTMVLTYTVIEETEQRFPVTSFATDSLPDIKVYDLQFRNLVTTASGSHFAVEANAIYLDTAGPGIQAFGLDLTFYPTTKLGISLSSDYIDGANNNSSTGYGLDLEYFITSSTAIFGGFSRGEEDEIDSDIVIFGISARL